MFFLIAYLQDLNYSFRVAVPMVPHNISITPVIAVGSTVEFRSLIKCRAVFGARHGRACGLIKKFLGWESRLLCCQCCCPRAGRWCRGWAGGTEEWQGQVSSALRLSPPACGPPPDHPQGHPPLLEPPHWPGWSTGSKILCPEMQQKFGESVSKTTCCCSEGLFWATLKQFFDPQKCSVYL